MNYVLNRFIVVAAALSLFVCQGTSAGSIKLAAALVGDGFVSGMPDDDKYPTNKWLALHYEAGAWKLSPSKVVFKMSKDQDFVLIEPSVKNHELLFRAKNLAAGAVVLLGGGACARSKVKGCPTLAHVYNTKSKFQLGTNRYELIFERTGFATVQGIAFQKLRFRLRQIQPNLLEQVIHEYEVDNGHRDDDDSISINAVGDFDGDGKIDLVYSDSNNESPEVELYLSSEAKSGQLVGKAKPLKK